MGYLSNGCGGRLIIHMTLLISSCKQTKCWRFDQSWWRGGKKTECEKFQIGALNELLGKELGKTNFRIHKRYNRIEDVPQPYTKQDGFDWTENFDGISRDTLGHPTFFTFKMICDSGGAQTRSLKDVYGFVESQLKHVERCLKSTDSTPPNFVNILDGNTSFKHMGKFKYLLSFFPVECEYVFVGDLKTYVDKERRVNYET